MLVMCLPHLPSETAIKNIAYPPKEGCYHNLQTLANVQRICSDVHRVTGGHYRVTAPEEAYCMRY